MDTQQKLSTQLKHPLPFITFAAGVLLAFLVVVIVNLATPSNAASGAPSECAEAFDHVEAVVDASAEALLRLHYSTSSSLGDIQQTVDDNLQQYDDAKAACLGE